MLLTAHQDMQDKISNRMKTKRHVDAERHNRKISPEKFHSGDWVYVFDNQLQGQKGRKLDPKWQGPFRIIGQEREYVSGIKGRNGRVISSVHVDRMCQEKQMYGPILKARNWGKWT